jgi:hypothetical protein
MKTRVSISLGSLIKTEKSKETIPSNIGQQMHRIKEEEKVAFVSTRPEAVDLKIPSSEPFAMLETVNDLKANHSPT